ncbi:MAG: CRISPR-associated endonuclease Cas3'' [Pseudonocardiaceae bacterium]
MDPSNAENEALSVLWGKSNAHGSMNLLLQHLLDTAAVAELMWDRFLAPVIKNKIDACCEGRGRSFFALVCGLHDVGKASPAFQAKAPALAEPVRAAGLSWRNLDRCAKGWHHTLAGAHILSRVLPAAGWSAEAVEWVVPLVAGHHGVILGAGVFRCGPRRTPGAFCRPRIRGGLPTLRLALPAPSLSSPHTLSTAGEF